MTANRTFVIVRVRFDGIHHWGSAENFLRHPHQHEFAVQLKIETLAGDNSRSLEFFEVKRELVRAICVAFPTVDALGVRNLGGNSTEAIADRIHDQLPECFVQRHTSIRVDEDQTQGSESEYPARDPEAVSEDVMISKEQIDHRVSAIGKQITADYSDKPSLTVVCLLKGAFVFVADLIRQARHPQLKVEFLRMASYTGTKRGAVKTIGPLPKVKGRHVLLVDDIYDSGHTLKHAVELLTEAGAASVRVAVLLRRSHNTIPVNVHYHGFVVDNDDFVAGYGLDVDERQRELPYLRKAA